MIEDTELTMTTLDEVDDELEPLDETPVDTPDEIEAYDSYVISQEFQSTTHDEDDDEQEDEPDESDEKADEDQLLMQAETVEHEQRIPVEVDEPEAIMDDLLWDEMVDPV